MATKLPLDLELSPLGGEPRELEQWLTTFHLATVVLDPYTNESSWLLKTATRILGQLRGAHARMTLLVTADAQDARSFLGPYADQFLVFCDPHRTAVKAMELTQIPAFVFVTVDGTIEAKAEGWNAHEWLEVTKVISVTTKWRPPTIPVASDPGPFAGSPALG